MCHMAPIMFFVISLMVTIFSVSKGQTTGDEDEDIWPEERGLIVTTWNRYSWRSPVQLRHLPIFPGYENYSGTVPGVVFPNRNIHFVSIDVDYRIKNIYMYEYHQRSIMVGTGYNKDMNDLKFDTIHVGVSRGNVQVAVDWLSHTVYWCDSTFRWIVAAPGETDKINLDYYKIIVDTDLEAPDGLTIDPLEGLLFWSDNGKHPKIERSNLKGDNRHTIISKYLQSPLTLEADIFDKRIYWVDSTSQSILSSTYDGSDIITIQKVPNSRLLDLAIFREVLYISDIQNGYIYTLNKTKGLQLGKQESTNIRIFPEIFYGLAVYSEQKQPLKEKDYCAEKNCDHLCISTETGAECVCTEGFEIDVNTRKCKEVIGGYHKAIVVANKTHICFTDIRSFAKANHEYECKFSVEKESAFTGFPPTFMRKRRQTYTSLPSTGTTKSFTAITKDEVTTEPNVASPSTHRNTRPGMFSMYSWYRSTSRPRPITKPMPNRTRPFSTQRPRQTTVKPTKEPTDYIKMFDMDMTKRIFFFATQSNRIFRRPVDLPIENDMREVIVAASGNISGLAFDAEIGDNLYWCESDTGEVWVVNVETKTSKIVKGDFKTLRGARNIITISNYSMLAMVTGRSNYKYIKTLTMDGARVNTIIQGLRTITGLTYDSSEKVLYYLNGYYLFKISIMTKISKLVYMSVDDGAFNLLHYQNYLVWVHEDYSGNFVVNTLDLVTAKSVKNGYLGNTSMDIVDMKVLDQRLQSTNFTKPCAFEDGGCSQICITKYINDVMTPVCECHLGYFLADDNLTCISDVDADNFILAADMTNNELLQISLDNNAINAIPNLDNDQYKGVFIDMATKKVFWTESYNSKIYNANLNGTEEQELADLVFQGYPKRLDKDMTTGNIYFTSNYDDFIGVLTPFGEIMELYSVYTTSSLGDLVVHPGKGVLYFTRDYYRSTYIGRVDMDGTNEIELIKGKHVEDPSGLAIDFINDHLYWSDSYYDTIQQCDLNGKSCVTIINMTGSLRDEGIRDIVTDGVYLYYSAYRKDHIVRVGLTSPYDIAVVGQSPGMGNLDSIAFYSSTNKNKQAVSVACRAREGRGDCSTICLPTMSGRTCACENGADLKADGRTCSNVFQCTDLLQQVVEVNGIKEEIDITFSSLCPRHLNDRCRYRCPDNFVPLFDTILTCTNVGWDLESKTLCEESRCPPTIPNGKLDPFCGREIGLACDYKCNAGYVKAVDKVVCTANGTYQISEEELCQYVKCPLQIRHGQVSGECSQRVGEECSFQCNKGYRATISKRQMKCRSDGFWDIADIACSERVCEGTIGFGKINSDCNMKIGERCDYSCIDGFIPTREKAICTSNGTFHIPDNGLCKPFTCSEKIDNGEIDQGCSRTLGQACTYICNKYFTPVVKTRITVCSKNGWNPSSSTLCKESLCRNDTLANGNIIGPCIGKVGEKCFIQCEPGFVNATNVAVCLDDLYWHPKDMCQAFTCSDRIENGKLGKNCNKKIGSQCTFSCDKYYTPSVPNMQIICQAAGWNSASSSLCKESVCEDPFENGKVQETCSKRIGESCEYNCDSGYINTTTVAICKSDKKWHPRDPCTIIKCPATIFNGAISKQCSRTVGSRCNYTCNTNYVTNSLHSQIVCGSKGQWDVSDILCLESECKDSSIPNGRVDDTCKKNVGETCTFKCNTGFKNTTSAVVCRNDYMWHPIPSCLPLTCKPYIQNGEIERSCNLSIGETCHFSCFDGFKLTDILKTITCNASGHWNITKNICLGDENIETVKSSRKGLPVTSVSVGFAALLVVIIVLAGTFAFLIWRRKVKSFKTTLITPTSRHRRNLEFENPGYSKNTELSSVQTTDIDLDDQVHPTATDDTTTVPSYISDVREEEDISHSFENEPLPDVAQIDLTNDTTVLTTDSWLKERERNLP